MRYSNLIARLILVGLMSSATGCWLFAQPIQAQSIQQDERFPAQSHYVTLHAATADGGGATSRHNSPENPGTTPVHKIGLVLTGGGSRGFSQIGVLKVLEELGMPIYAIVGTSIGGMVGGLYASGYSAADLDSIVRTTDWSELLGIGDEERRSELFIDQKLDNDRSLLTLRLDGFRPQLPEAISTGARLTAFVERLIWESTYHSGTTFDHLKFRFRAMATDLVTGRGVALDRGNLALALRASATIPLRFSPVAMDSMLLVDGGLVANVPVNVARDLGCDIVIVIDAGSPLLTAEKLNTPWSVADQVVTLMMQQQSQVQLANADVVITPDLTNHTGIDFSYPGAIIDSGEVAARRLVPRLQAIIKQVTKRGRVFHNVEVACTDKSLVASLGLNHISNGIGLDELQKRLDGLGTTGAYYDLTAEIEYRGDTARLAISGLRGRLVDTIAYHGFEQPPTQPITQCFQVLVGLPHNRDSIRLRTQEVVGRARRAGHAFFFIDSVQLNEPNGCLDVYVDEGMIREVRIEGLEHCAEFIVARELEFQTGDLFRTDVAASAVNRILRTGFFKDARIQPYRLKQGGIGVVVQVSERSTSLLRFSANINSERFTRIGVELSQENLFGYGTRVAARLATGLRDRVLSLDLRSNRIYGTYWTYGMIGYSTMHDVDVYAHLVDRLEGQIERHSIGEYRELRLGASVRFGRQVERLGMFSIEGRFERQGTRSLTNGASDGTWITVGTLKGGTRFDTRDRVPYSRRGAVIDVSYETAQPWLGADVSFVKFNVEAELYASITHEHVIHPLVHVGFGDVTLPLLEQFTLGGQRSMFGLREDESRGRQIFLASLEYRYLLPFKVYFDAYLSARYDMGATWLNPVEITLQDLEHGVGISMGLDTPLGPAEISLGQSFSFNKPIVPNLMNVGPLVAYFSFGYQFD